MDFKYPKKQKLKSTKSINSLFTKGKSVSKYPLRIVFVEQEIVDNSGIKFGVSVSKKYFKKAVDRNYFKRVLRECYRLNKSIILDNIQKKYAMMFFYQTSQRLTYQEVNEKTILLFEKFIKTLNQQNN